MNDAQYRRVVAELHPSPAIDASELASMRARLQALRDRQQRQDVAVSEALATYRRLIPQLEATIALVRACTAEMRAERLGPAPSRGAETAPELALRVRRQAALVASLSTQS